jgi:hypothetical protein
MSSCLLVGRSFRIISGRIIRGGSTGLLCGDVSIIMLICLTAFSIEVEQIGILSWGRGQKQATIFFIDEPKQQPTDQFPSKT